MKESQFWALVKGKMLGDVERVENALTRGTPDVNGCYNGQEYWLELKILDAKGNCELRPEQYLWHRKRQEHGGRVFVLARNDTLIKLFQVQKDMSLFEFWRCTKPFDWNMMNQLIFSTPVFVSDIKFVTIGEMQ